MLKILESNELPDIEYIKEPRKKTKIVLHHTVSSSVSSVVNWWKSDKGKSRIATAYCIDKNGDVFQLFKPEYWAYHVGYGAGTLHNKSSIGIEIVNEGAIEKKNGKYYWYDTVEYKGEVVELEEEWRGFKYFAPYTNAQMDSLVELLEYLFQKFPKIPRQFINNFNYDENNLTYNGVQMHCNLRPDKTDLSPVFDIERFNSLLFEPKILPLNAEIIPFSKWWEDYNMDYVLLNEQEEGE